jgi:tetratricopeptide (TPR) repeat protein
MGVTRAKRTPKKSRRHWRIPPPPLRDGDAPGPEGLLVLHDLEGEFGVVVWKMLRSILLWAETSPSERATLFSDDAGQRRRAELLAVTHGEDHPILEPMESLLRMMEPDSIPDPDEVGVACMLIAGWADENEFPRTAIEFRQAAALSCPSNPRFALSVLRTARDLAQYSRAEAWFHRSVGLARQCRDWDTYVRAYLAHGTMMRRRGALPAARRSYLKALRRATRQGLSEVRSMTLHDLFVLEEYASNREAADRYAELAADSYGPGHRSLPILAHDVAVAWLQQGYFENSLKVLRSVFPYLPEAYRPVALGSLARSSAGVGDTVEFARARRDLSRIPPGPGVAEAWVEVARGSLLLGNREEARDAVRRGEDLARSRMEGQIRFMAQSMFEAIEAEEAAARETAPEPAGSGAASDRSRLADRLVVLLEPLSSGDRRHAAARR